MSRTAAALMASSPLTAGFAARLVARLAAGLVAGLGIALAGCRSTDPALIGEGGRPLREAEPAAYRIAVAPFEMDPALGRAARASAVLRGPAELQAELVRALADVDAASDVFALGSANSFDAFREKADLLVIPRLEAADFESARRSGRAFLSGLLWLTTWIGSLWVEDVSYPAAVVVSCDLVDPHTGSPVAGGVKARSGGADLTFWERDRAFSKGFFLTLLMPPFLVADDPETASRSLARRIAALTAAQLKAYLLESLPQREIELLAQVRLKAPRNGAEVDGRTSLQCDIVARRAVTEVLLFVNEELRRRWGEGELPSPAEQSRDGRFLCPLRADEVDVARPGRNVIRVLVNVAGQWVSRSVVLRAGARPAERAGGKA